MNLPRNHHIRVIIATLTPKTVICKRHILVLLTLSFCLSVGNAQIKSFSDHNSAYRVDTIDCCRNIWRHVYLLDSTLEVSPEAILSGSLDSHFQKEISNRQLLEPRKAHWGAFSLINKDRTDNFFISFPLDISYLTLYEVRADTIIKSQVGSLLPKKEEISNPPLGSVDYFFKTELPQDTPIKFYFKITDESGRVEKGYFTPNVFKMESYYERIIQKTRRTIFFEGAVGIFLLLNLILFYFLRSRQFFYYVTYLITILIYGIYSSGLMKEWNIFPNIPELKHYLRLNYYLVSISYLAFIRSFLNLKQLLPVWDIIFKGLIRIATTLLVFSLFYFAIIRYNIALIDAIYGVYLIIAFGLIIAFMFPLFRVKDVRSKFIFWGSFFIISGVMPSILTLLFGVITVGNIIYIQLGLAGEMVVFSLGLAYNHYTSERAKQEAIRRTEITEEKSKIYTNITHEFRTPITVILGLADEIQQGYQKHAAVIKRNGKELLRLVNQMLALSKLESGKEKLEWRQGDIVTFSKYIVESFQSFASAQGIQLSISSEMESLMMDYDAEKLQLILSNLLSNAIKFTPTDGRVTIALAKHKQQFHINISDTGEGIAVEQLPFIFDRYYQADSILESTGSGIGLTLVKEYVQMLEGKIKVESELGQGTTFQIQLPIRQLATKTTPSQPQLQFVPQPKPQSRSKPQPTSTPKILLVEDNMDVLNYLSLFLQKQYDLRYAYNGAEGIRKAISEIPDLIISDVMMPKKNGYELCAQLKKDERTSHIPIILLTAKADFDSKITGLGEGADVYLSKPFRKQELLVQIQRLLKQRQALQVHYSFLATLPTKQYQVSGKEESFLHKLQSLIEGRMEEEGFDIATICKILGISRTHLGRKIKALTGKTTSEYIREIRLQRAKDLLANTDWNITEIAYKVGFKTVAYFSSSFTAYFEQSPSAYRKSNT